MNNTFRTWLDRQWNELCGIPEDDIGFKQLEIARFISYIRSGGRRISDACRGMPIANYLCSLQFVDGGWRRGSWSFMTESEWDKVAKATEEQCWKRDAEWWNLQ